jgi:hypothetical protein
MSVFLITIGDARAGGPVDEVVGVYTSHQLALEVARVLQREREYNPDHSYGVLIEEIQLDQRLV